MGRNRSAVLELAVLGVLHRTPMHGYELRKQITSVLGLFRALSYGSLYPCLHELLAAGLIAEEHDENRAGPYHRGRPAASRPAGAEGVPADGRRQGTAAGPPRRGRSRGVGRRRVRSSLRVFRADEGRRTAPDPRGAAQPARGAHGVHPGGSDANQGARGQLHPGTAPAWPGVSGTRSPVAERADRLRAARPANQKTFPIRSHPDGQGTHRHRVASSFTWLDPPLRFTLSRISLSAALMRTAGLVTGSSF